MVGLSAKSTRERKFKDVCFKNRLFIQKTRLAFLPSSSTRNQSYSGFHPTLLCGRSFWSWWSTARKVCGCTLCELSLLLGSKNTTFYWPWILLRFNLKILVKTFSQAMDYLNSPHSSSIMYVIFWYLCIFPLLADHFLYSCQMYLTGYI